MTPVGAERHGVERPLNPVSVVLRPHSPSSVTSTCRSWQATPVEPAGENDPVNARPAAVVAAGRAP